ncbi:MAG: hypothetical protein AB3N14_09750 [Flavobacteriaceae bacterium]
MIKLSSINFMVLAATILVGCGGSSASRDTAEAVLGAMFQKNASSPEELVILKEMPEFKEAVDCLTNHLDQAGWDQEKHNFLMTETNNTGNIHLINQRKFSQEEQLEHFGPLLTSSCL